MMKVWFVIIHNGVIGGTIGPSPMTLDQCQVFAVEKTGEFEKAIATGLNIKGEKISATDMVEVKKFSFTCVEAISRPQNGSAL